MSKTEAVCSKILVPIALLLALRLSAAVYSNFPHTTTNAKKQGSPKFNYASYEAGAKVLAYSGHITGAKGLLQDSRDKYMVVPCHYTQEWIEMSLSEDIRLESLEILSGELYSSSFTELILEGSAAYPTMKWTSLGQFPLASGVRKQAFPLKQRLWLRYLRITFQSVGVSTHYYCSMNHLSVYGSTLMQGLREEMADSRHQTKQKLMDYKSFQGYITPYNTRPNGIEESLLLIANMQHIRQNGLKATPYSHGAVLYLNETTSQKPYEYWGRPEKCGKHREKVVGGHRGNDSVSLFKQVTDQVVSTAVKMEAMGDYMSLLEQLSLKTQSKISDLDLNIALVEGQMEGLSKQQSAQDQENSIKNEQFSGEISSLRAALYAMTRELEDTKSQLMFVGCFAVCNAVFMILMAACYKPGTGIQIKPLRPFITGVEDTPKSGGNTSKTDPERMTFSHVAKDRARRKKRF